ncbi:hypothetical protein QJS04_geneDACA000980 [Acorus gramineus]|uniref:Endonuclease/exonuclease/phosphatase domain-containing protein n=1 Tax=Acorus gramineus TaxID=55184 RepID=A0AAV9AET6_ACOGR|nr:hypothetical protein QJS04_geneDACA000980 [Acorus gramineus]
MSTGIIGGWRLNRTVPGVLLRGVTSSLMFSCLIWNIRGLHDPAKRRALRDMVATHKIQICCIQETKMELVDRPTITELGAGLLDGWSFKGARGAAGGILICWNSSLWRAVEQSVGNFSLSILMEDLQSGGRWCCSSIYGPNEDAEREILWHELSTIRARWSAPVAFMGDFNVIRRMEERNRTGYASPAMNTFSDWIEEEGLIDLPISNHEFTWSNMREEPSLARLDRALIDEEWEEMYPNCGVRGLPRVTSDHVPLLLESSSTARRPRGPFRFESWWCEVEGVEGLIRQSWDASASGLRGARRVAFKLRRLKRVLRQWSRTVRAARTEKKCGLLQDILRLDREEEQATLSEDDRAARYWRQGLGGTGRHPEQPHDAFQAHLQQTTGMEAGVGGPGTATPQLRAAHSLGGPVRGDRNLPGNREGRRRQSTRPRRIQLNVLPKILVHSKTGRGGYV